ncbi:MAG: thermonuclease family protein [Candidatus Competibacteraceae bacterium]|nr:thermonuclease family protein [Candidatus Competibacteraceae bacterium]
MGQWCVIGLILSVMLIPAMAETLTGRVVGVHDGDTLTLLVGVRQVKVRLAGIDAPELKQPYGQKAKQALSDWAYGKAARIESAGPDRYGRTLGTVFVGAVNVNAALVEQGAAWVYRRYPHPPELEVLEAQAQAAKRGLWGLQSDQRCSPWDWRRKACTTTHQPTRPKTSGSCGAKRICKEMSSCEEARFYLTRCGLTRLDMDKDGVPCEAVCR